MKFVSVFVFVSVVAITPLLSTASSHSDADSADFDPVASEEKQEVIDQLALSDAETRDAILTASLHPESIRSIAALQREMSRAFRELVVELPRSRQEEIWELIRYPELIEELARRRPRSDSEFDRVLAPYPEKVVPIARRWAEDDYPLLANIYVLRVEADEGVSRILELLPLETQARIQSLVAKPDIMTLLAENPDVVEELGRTTRRDPDRSARIFSDRHDELVLENEELIDEWRYAMENNPVAAEEYKESAAAFAIEQGYEPPIEEAIPVEQETVIQVVRVVYPYPYWFGLPYFYPAYWAGYWYPNRYYTHWGFNYGSSGWWIYGLPSPIFTYWHFHKRHHYQHNARYYNLHRNWKRHVKRHPGSRNKSYRMVRHHEKGNLYRDRRGNRNDFASWRPNRELKTARERRDTRFATPETRTRRGASWKRGPDETRVRSEGAREQRRETRSVRNRDVASKQEARGSDRTQRKATRSAQRDSRAKKSGATRSVQAKARKGRRSDKQVRTAAVSKGKPSGKGTRTARASKGKRSGKSTKQTAKASKGGKSGVKVASGTKSQSFTGASRGASRSSGGGFRSSGGSRGGGARMGGGRSGGFGGRGRSR